MATQPPPQRKQVSFGSKPLQWAGLAWSQDDAYQLIEPQTLLTVKIDR
jgi:hypothetical protein